MILGRDTVTRVRYADERDAFGDYPVSAAPLELDIPGCSVQPRASSENVDQRDTVVTLLTAFLPLGYDVLPTDQIRWREALYEVDAQPSQWIDLTSAPHHLELTLRRVGG